MRGFRVAAAVCVCGLIVAAAAHADGGTSIATSPELPNGQQVAAAVARLDYWRVTIVPGDTLRINYEPVGMSALPDPRVALCLMAPNVTDFTVGDARCVDPKSTNYSDRKRQTAYEFTLPGRYSLVVGSYACNVYYGPPNTKCDRPLGYELTAFVVHRTKTTLLRAAKLVNRGSIVSIRGAVNGLANGKVLLQQRSGGWSNKRIVNVSAGRFAIRLRVTTTGEFRYRVLFRGDATHKPSSASFSLTVV